MIVTYRSHTSYLYGGDFLATSVDELLDAAREGEETLLIQETLIACVEPAPCNPHTHPFSAGWLTQRSRHNMAQPACSRPTPPSHPCNPPSMHVRPQAVCMYSPTPFPPNPRQSPE